MDHKLGIQSLEQTLVGALHVFLILKKSLDISANLTVKGVGIHNFNINVSHEYPWEAIK